MNIIEEIKERYINLLGSISDLDIREMINLFKYEVSEIQLSYLLEWGKQQIIKNRLGQL